MTVDVDQLEREADDIDRDANQEAIEAQAIAAASGGASEAEARHHADAALVMHLRARQKRKDAQKIRQKLDEYMKQIQDLQRQIDSKLQEKKYLQDSDQIVGEAMRLEANAKEADKLSQNLLAKDDDYSQSEGQKRIIERDDLNNQASQKRQEAEELHQQHQSIDREVDQLQQQIKAIETKINSL